MTSQNIIEQFYQDMYLEDIRLFTWVIIAQSVM